MKTMSFEFVFCFIFAFVLGQQMHAGVSDDGLMLPIDKDSNYTNADVIVYMVNVENDASAPREKFAYPFQKEFLNDYVQNYYKLRTDYILVVENHSPYPYAFSPQYAASGYDCLELDFLTSDKRILTASKRMPHLLSDSGEENLLKPNWQWKYLISLDIRLWKKPDGFSVDLITHFRPRFAYGAFSVDGRYYRTSAELEAHKRKDWPFKSREGELVGFSAPTAMLAVMEVICRATGNVKKQQPRVATWVQTTVGPYAQ